MDEAFELSEELADVLGAVGFLLLGAGLIVPVIQRATPEMFIYAILSLTVVRMAPVALVMLRTGFAPASMLYVGWFGPRGLASIVFATVVVEEAVPGASALTDVVLLTVAISMVVHGVTAAWGAGRYASWFEAAAAATRHPGGRGAGRCHRPPAYRAPSRGPAIPRTRVDDRLMGDACAMRRR